MTDLREAFEALVDEFDNAVGMQHCGTDTRKAEARYNEARAKLIAAWQAAQEQIAAAREPASEGPQNAALAGPLSPVAAAPEYSASDLMQWHTPEGMMTFTRSVLASPRNGRKDMTPETVKRLADDFSMEWSRPNTTNQRKRTDVARAALHAAIDELANQPEQMVTALEVPQAPVQSPSAPARGIPWWQTAKDCGCWTDKTDGDMGYVHFGSTEALRVFVTKISAQAYAAGLADAAPGNTNKFGDKLRPEFQRFMVDAYAHMLRETRSGATEALKPNEQRETGETP